VTEEELEEIIEKAGIDRVSTLIYPVDIGLNLVTGIPDGY
jgi:hypothetical protein